MKTAFILISLITATLSATASDNVAQQQGWKPDAAQAAVIGPICQQWGVIAGGVFMMKSAGQPKPKANSALHAQIIDEIYSAKTSVTTQGTAESMGEQFCVPVLKEKFRTGQLRVKGSSENERTLLIK